jgi:GNAT superfamily N-acetyltransferase
VLPQYQQQGIGRALVEYVIDYAKSKNITFISIGIIASRAVTFA